MHNLKPITPLGAETARVDQFSALTIAEVPDRALASLTAREGCKEFREKASAFLGFELPSVGQSAAGSAYAAFWIGPESWMVDAPYGGNEDLARQVKAAVEGSASVVEQTDGWCRFDLSGEATIAVLERLCNADCQQMAVGAVTRTQIHHLGCFMWRQDGVFTVIGPRSSAGSLHHALMQTAQSVCGLD
ncbi:sarcosine oxidase subunit gamma [Aliiroseovarius halocynthiae]|uniref:Sarcosine oxidase subunit gamma n=1 Tax=Aliiroseovarius halocynthiae TaxID=985055 RepID=A0A545SSB9_9RHOB|nr:sarcosine oxidase subunit gamma [Aliiroseovarius halocynthiae]TQV67863.1 sarcosine oxidase subunit gamma [Aliiroseovarius halocynthiae]SMR72955.1 sarcosine oxidase subunit gamma [Aliiroseovarius halocynthiae]